MGSKELAALAAVIEAELARGREGHVLGTWTIRFDKERQAFSFDKCEHDYCEERPALIGVGGEVLDPGGPLFA